MKNNPNYVPKPIDTSDVVLPEELMSLVEDMSRNVHDVWAETRINDGWRYGDMRSDELPESEREYDRNTAVGTLKLIYKLGFKITKV